MTPDQIQFLNSDNQNRLVLAELSYHDGTSQKTEYVSNQAFISKPADTDPNRPYDEVLKQATIKDDIRANTITGSITLYNQDRDNWLTRAWRGWPFKLLVGDPTWSRNDFIEIFSGILGSPKASGNTITLSVYDQRETLKVPVQENTLANHQPIPLCYGDCFNVPAVLINVGTHEYQCHELAVTSFPKSRDNGIVVGKLDNIAEGKFTLTQSPFGDIRCDVVGETTGGTNEIIKILAKRAGLTDSDFDSSVDLFTQKQSLFIKQNQNIDSLLTKLCRSLGAYWSFNALNKLQIRQFEVPGVILHTLTPDDIHGGGISLVKIDQPVTEIRLLFNKNWGSQSPDQLSELVPQNDVDKYSKEYETQSSINAGVSQQFPLAEKKTITTYLTATIEAQSEANRRAGLRNVNRATYKLLCYTSPFKVQIGDTVNVTYNGLGFENGRNVVVIKKTLRPSKNSVELEVWV